MDAVFLEVDAKVRYPEDSTVNGVEDEEGNLMPFFADGRWKPRIRLADGAVMDWPADMTAGIHYKVADEGEYYLLNAAGERIAKWASHYVPEAFLCHGDDGYGDYIIFRVGLDGKIRNYRRPVVAAERWIRLDGR